MSPQLDFTDVYGTNAVVMLQLSFPESLLPSLLLSLCLFPFHLSLFCHHVIAQLCRNKGLSGRKLGRKGREQIINKGLLAKLGKSNQINCFGSPIHTCLQLKCS